MEYATPTQFLVVLLCPLFLVLRKYPHDARDVRGFRAPGAAGAVRPFQGVVNIIDIGVGDRPSGGFKEIWPRPTVLCVLIIISVYIRDQRSNTFLLLPVAGSCFV